MEEGGFYSEVITGNAMNKILPGSVAGSGQLAYYVDACSKQAKKWTNSIWHKHFFVGGLDVNIAGSKGTASFWMESCRWQAAHLRQTTLFTVLYLMSDGWEKEHVKLLTNIFIITRLLCCTWKQTHQFLSFQAYLRLSFGILQDCHRVWVGNCMTHNSWTKNSGQVTDVHLGVHTARNSVKCN